MMAKTRDKSRHRDVIQYTPSWFQRFLSKSLAQASAEGTRDCGCQMSTFENRPSLCMHRVREL
jgi:hypothetical protein